MVRIGSKLEAVIAHDEAGGECGIAYAHGNDGSGKLFAELACRCRCTDVSVQNIGDRAQRGFERVHDGSHPVADVQCYDSGGEVVVTAALETGLFHHGLECFLVRVHANGFREVLVTVRIPGDEFSERGKYFE